MKLDNAMIGSAGEYFVAGELSRRGLIAALTMSGTDAFDILAVRKETQETFAIQVKTTQYQKASWLLGKKDEAARGTHAFYVFVRLNGTALPEYYIIPAAEVAQKLREDHMRWMNTLGKDGKPHKESGIRELRIEPGDARYYNRWDYFGL